jgi:hypothetical protein
MTCAALLAPTGAIRLADRHAGRGEGGVSYGAVGSGAEVPHTRAASPQPVLLLVRGLGDGGLDPAFAQVGADSELVWISDPIQGARHDVFCLDDPGFWTR